MTYCNTDTPDDFTTDTEQNCSNNNLVLVTASREHINSLKQKPKKKLFIIESLLANYNTASIILKTPYSISKIHVGQITLKHSQV